MFVCGFATTLNPMRASRAVAGPRAYTLLEVCVAMIVFSIALTGLVPLVTILSRDLQPYRTSSTPGYKCSSPARDGNTTGTNLAYARHEWYFTTFDNSLDSGPWVAKLIPWTRKLGASAQVTSTSSAKVTMPTVPMTASELVQNDSEPADGGFSSTGMTWVSAGGYKTGGYHKIDASTEDAISAVATWTLTVPADGWYSVQATWPTDTGLTLANALYQVTTNPAQTIPSRTWNQASPGTGIRDDDTSRNNYWWPITPEAAAPYIALHKNDTVTVTLSVPKATLPGGVVIADAVRIVQNTVKIKSVERSLDGANNNSHDADATVQASVTVNVPQ
jgi:hypothetical protein